MKGSVPDISLAHLMRFLTLERDDDEVEKTHRDTTGIVEAPLVLDYPLCDPDE